MSSATKESIDCKAVMGGITSKGVQWEIIPALCQLRNRGVKRAIQMAKRTLKKKLKLIPSLTSKNSKPPLCCLSHPQREAPQC